MQQIMGRSDDEISSAFKRNQNPHATNTSESPGLLTDHPDQEPARF